MLRLPGSQKGMLVVLGLTLGATTGLLVKGLPTGSIIERFESIRQPSARAIRSADLDLKDGDTASARLWFDQAIATAGTPEQTDRVLSSIQDVCLRRRSWQLGRDYGARAVQTDDSPMSQARYGEMLLAAGDPEDAASWLAKALSVPESAFLGWNGQDAYASAQRDLAMALIWQDKDLDRAQGLAENAIRSLVHRHSGSPILVSLNDTLGWLHYWKGMQSGDPVEMELARIYTENATGDLVRQGDRELSAAVLYHLSKIYSAQGAQAAAKRAYKSATEVQLSTVRMLERMDERIGSTSGA